MKTNNNKIIYYLTGQTDQIRKASRSACANLKEAWSKRRYIAHFPSKLIPTCRDDGENGETETWVDFAKDCKYIGVTDYNPDESGIERNKRIGQMLGNMINKADVFCNK